jgi:hypothetical protein
VKASLVDQLAALAADYRSKAQAIDQTLAILREQALVTKRARTQTVLAKAVTLDAQRVNGTRATLLLGDGNGKKPLSTLDRRKQTQRLLWKFTTAEPRIHRTKNPSIIASLVRYGYLKEAAKGGGYVRTDKEFSLKSGDE